MRRLAKSIARNGPHANAPSRAASAVPKITGTADAVREKGRARRNHSAKMDRRGFVTFTSRALYLDLRFPTWLLSRRTIRVIL